MSNNPTPLPPSEAKRYHPTYAEVEAAAWELYHLPDSEDLQNVSRALIAADAARSSRPTEADLSGETITEIALREAPAEIRKYLREPKPRDIEAFALGAWWHSTVGAQFTRKEGSRE